MDFETFKNLVYKEFGTDLRRATPSNVREFVARLHDAERDKNEPIVLNERHMTLESIYKDFFSKSLSMPKDQALILLWTVGIELAFGVVEDQIAMSAQLMSLFRSLEEE